MYKKQLLMSIFMLFLVSGIAYANPTISLETTTWGSNSNVSIPLTDGNNVTSILVEVSSTLTANSSSSVVVNISNTTGTNFMASGHANFTFDSSIILEDANNYAYTITSTGTGDSQGVTGTGTGLTVDRTAPSAPTTSHTEAQVFEAGDVITYTVTGTDTTSCRISFGRGNKFTGTNTYAMTHSGNSCTYTISANVIPDGVYQTRVQASDETNTTVDSANLNFAVDTVASNTEAIGDFQVDVAEKVAKDRLNTVFLLIAFAIGAYLIMDKN